MRDKIISYIKLKGPVIPRDIGRYLGKDTTIAGAMLSELTDNKHLLISNTKIGGSPFYYLPEQKEKLQDISRYLNEKDLKAYHILKERKVIRDNAQPALLRVALRSIKDFAIPIQVNLPTGQELFWKWYLSSKDEAEHIIKSGFKLESDEKKKLEQEQQMLKEAHKKPEQEITAKGQESYLFSTLRSPRGDTRIPLNSERAAARAETRSVLNKYQESKTEHEKPEEKKLENAQQTPEKKKHDMQKPLVNLNEKPVTKTEPELKKSVTPTDDSFFTQLKAYFSQSGIEVLETEIVKKKSEIDLLLRVPSAVGAIDYFCKARNKKRCSEGDLSSAFVKGQLKNLPTLFLSPGTLTKKAQQMLEQEFKNHLVYKQI